MILTRQPLLVSMLLAGATVAVEASVFAGSESGRPTQVSRSGTSTNTPHAELPGKIWDQPSFVENLSPKCVALGTSGTIVFTDFEGLSTFSRTLSSFDSSPATAVSQSAPSFARRSCVVRAAEETDVRVDLAYVQATSASATYPTLTRSSFIGGGADWSFTFPFSISASETSPLGLGISRDGQTIVAIAFNRIPGTLAIAVFHPGSPTPVWYQEVLVFYQPMNFALSSDGSTLCVVAQLYTLLYDTQQNVATFNGNVEYPYGALAISADGSRYAKSFAADHRVDVYQKQSGGYVLYGTFPDPGFGECAALAMSDDGETLVGAYATPPASVTSVVLDLSSTPPTPVFHDSIVGDGPYWNTVRDLSISKDGATYALAITGSLSGDTPQMQAYGRGDDPSSWSSLLKATLRGSALDVDVSADGTKVAVASMIGHWDAPIGGGEISLYRLRSEDLVAHGVPTPSAQIQFVYEPEIPANLGSAVLLLESPSLANHVSVFPNVGTLYLDRSYVHSVGVGHIDASGVASVGLGMPPGGAAIGTTSYYQAMSLSPRRLSQTWLRVTVVP
jgi:hypothetical protein